MTEPLLLDLFYESCFDDKLITLFLTAAHSKGSKAADYGLMVHKGFGSDKTVCEGTSDFRSVETRSFLGTLSHL